MTEIIEARTPEQVECVRQLFQEYWRAFEFSPCFQNFADEVAGLPGAYAAPRGILALALVDGAPAGCIALRPLAADACEMKRFYVRDAFRGRGAGVALVRWLIDRARERGYTRMYADTMPVMQRALAMYDAIGFERIEPYTENATDGAIYLSLPL